LLSPARLGLEWPCSAAGGKDAGCAEGRWWAGCGRNAAYRARSGRSCRRETVAEPGLDAGGDRPADHPLVDCGGGSGADEPGHAQVIGAECHAGIALLRLRVRGGMVTLIGACSGERPRRIYRIWLNGQRGSLAGWHTILAVAAAENRLTRPAASRDLCCRRRRARNRWKSPSCLPRPLLRGRELRVWSRGQGGAAENELGSPKARSCVSATTAPRTVFR